MSRATLREIFQNGARGSDLAVVEGAYAAARDPREKASLESAADWLDLPQLALVDVRKLASCRLPPFPQPLAGLLLDRVRDTAEGVRWQTELEALLGVPVLGFLEESPKLRSLIAARGAGSPCRELCRTLGNRLGRNLRFDRLIQIARSRPFSPAQQRLFTRQDDDDRINIAVAFDEAFNGYFADTLDLLEARGARICDFSPLHSESLPWGTDIVYLGGGPVERFAESLSRNHCLKQSLRTFVAQGGRVYAESGGLAYLCERVLLPDGRQYPMVGLVPAVAFNKPPVDAPSPVELVFGARTWLGDAGTAMRGYLDEHWEILPEPDLVSFAADSAHRWHLVGNDRVIGCRLQVDFAGQPHLVSNFFRPRRGALVEA